MACERTVNLARLSPFTRNIVRSSPVRASEIEISRAIAYMGPESELHRAVHHTQGSEDPHVGKVCTRPEMTNNAHGGPASIIASRASLVSRTI